MADGRPAREPETPELRRLRRRIDALDRRIVALLNERAELAREAGAGQGRGRPAGDPRRRARARGPAPGDDGQRGPAPPGRPAGALPAADGRDAGARGARSGPARRRPVTGDRRLTRHARDPDPFRAGPDRLPPSRPRRERRLRVGHGAPRPAPTSCCASRTTTACGAGPSTTPPCSRTSRGSASRADAGPVRQSDDDAPVRGRARSAARRRPRLRLRLLAHDVRGMGRRARARWHGPGCPGGCRERGLDGPVLRVALGGGSERWMDALVGPCSDEVANDGDPPVRDRDGNWTYGFCVVVDDLRQGVDLVVRGRDLLSATAAQIRLGAPARARDAGRPSPTTRWSADRTAEAVEGGRRDLASATCARPGTAPQRSSRWQPRRSDDRISMALNTGASTCPITGRRSKSDRSGVTMDEELVRPGRPRGCRRIRRPRARPDRPALRHRVPDPARPPRRRGCRAARVVDRLVGPAGFARPGPVRCLAVPTAHPRLLSGGSFPTTARGHRQHRPRDG